MTARGKGEGKGEGREKGGKKGEEIGKKKEGRRKYTKQTDVPSFG